MKINNLDIPGIGSDGRYIDKDTTPGQEKPGTLVTAQVFNQLILELQDNFIQKAGITPSKDVVTQIYDAVMYFINTSTSKTTSEVKAVIEKAGLIYNPTDITQLNKALDKLLSPVVGSYMFKDGNNARVLSAYGTFLPMSGGSYLNSDYPQLAASLISAGLISSSATSFALPDLRGRVIQVADQGKGVDRDNASRGQSWALARADKLGTYQNDAMRHITGKQEGLYGNFIATGSLGALFSSWSIQQLQPQMSYKANRDLHFDNSRVTQVGGNNRHNNYATQLYIYAGSKD